MSAAAPQDRVTRSIDTARTRLVAGHLHRLPQAQFDRGPVDPDMRMDDMMLLVQPSAAQQTELEQLLATQQNPSSPIFRSWLTPDEFGARFGLNSGDYSKVVAWLTAEGFTVNQTARGRNWIAFGGTAGRVARALHTSIHRFQVAGVTHFTNTTEPSVPEALADVVAGFIGLDDFHLEPLARPVPPSYNSGASHYLAPEDFATIYNLAPLYQAGIDGTGQSIAVVGQSDVLLSDIRTFRSRYNLPANDPKMLLYGGTDPGYTGSQIEGNLDLEWAGAIAPKATLYYIYGTSALTAFVSAVNLNLAPIISISYGGCELSYRPTYYRAIAQQANAQGITTLVASGDAGAAGCDSQGSEPLATRGKRAIFPAALPEVTAVGGTQFVEGTGRYWAATNSPNLGSALSYIPEAAWNESAAPGLLSTGGGASLFHPKPAWQTGPGVPSDPVRHIPDVSLSAALHDAYFITYLGANGGVGGTSASAPSMAGIVALLNQYQIAKGFQRTPGLGNINPQLYRLAQSAPSAFHDIIAGDNIVPCAQGSPDCLTGSFGYPAAAGYDPATGLGSVDANNLVTQWNTKTRDVTVRLVVNPARPTLNDRVDATALVNAASGDGTATGTVSFSANGIPLGSAALAARGNQGLAADVSFPAYLLGSGAFPLVAEYSGDAAFSSGGAVAGIAIATPTGAAAIVPTWPNTVWPSIPDAQGLSWQTTISLREAAGVSAMITGFTIDGRAQPLAQYFPSAAIPARGTVSTTVVLRNLSPPVTRTFGFTGVDASGQTWSREVPVNYLYLPPSPEFTLSATPLTVNQRTAADSGCPWPVQLSIDELGGYRSLVTTLLSGGVDLTSKIPAIFGTTRLEAWGSLQGVVCFTEISPPASNLIGVYLSTGFAHEITVSFAGAPASPAKITAAPADIRFSTTGSSQTAQSTLAIDLTDKTQSWTASIFPANRTSAWLAASKLSGTGSGEITLTASGAGFQPGVYRASVVIQSAGAAPQYITVPVMFVSGGSTSGTSISSVANAASYQAAVSPGMILSIFGSNVANTTQTASTSPVEYSLAGVVATVNGVAAPVLFISPSQINIQVPYEIGAGPGVVGINKNGEIAGFPVQITPAAPGIFADAKGNAGPNVTAKQSATATVLVTGVGEITPALKTAYLPVPTFSSTPSAAPYRPVLPLSVTVGGVAAFVQSANLTADQLGTMQVTFLVPASVSPGLQPVVVTVNGASSPPANITVEAPAAPSVEPAH